MTPDQRHKLIELTAEQYRAAHLYRIELNGFKARCTSVEASTVIEHLQDQVREVQRLYGSIFHALSLEDHPEWQDDTPEEKEDGESRGPF